MVFKHQPVVRVTCVLLHDSLAVHTLIYLADAALQEAIGAANDSKSLLVGLLPSHELT